MTKILTFKKRKDFLRVAKESFVATHHMVLQAAPSLSDESFFHIGFTATKKIGNAVVRNRSKRRLRAIARELLPLYGNPAVDYIFIARNDTAECPFKELRRDTLYAIKRINKNFIPKNTTAVDEHA